MAIQIDKPEFRSTTAPRADDVARQATIDRPVEPCDREHRPTTPAAASIDYARLAAKLSAGRRDPESLNMLAVCQLRLGNIAEAVRIYRGLVLQPGCTWERADVPAVFKRNFATALLLSGLPGGCVSVLQGLRETDQPRCRELYAAIRRWERSLTFIQRWDWRLNGIAPKNSRIAIDFEPGEFA